MVCTLASLLLLAPAAHAAGKGGPILIDQAKALKGSVTPNDAPGFPVSINAGGLYRLMGNLDVTTAPDPPNTTAIEINAADVELDLNGFAILGPAGCSGVPVTTCSNTGSGTGIDSAASNASVSNGTVQAMGHFGVRLAGNDALVDGVRAIGNGSDGIQVGALGTVTGCQAGGNGGVGIQASTGTLVSGNVAAANQSAGIFVGDGASVLGNVTGTNGSHGVLTGVACTVRSNGVTNNTGFGLNLGTGSGYGDNVIDGNNGGNLNAQVSGGIEIGTNLCADNTTCP
jgi:hypothetical protein